MKINSSAWSLIIVLQLTLLISCSSPRVVLRTKPIDESPYLTSIFNKSSLTPQSKDYLESKGLMDAYKKNPAQTIKRVREMVDSESSVDGRMALIEMCAKTARRKEDKEPLEAAGYYLAATEVAFKAGFKSTYHQTEKVLFIEAYNANTEKVVRILFDPELPRDDWRVIEGPDRSFKVKIRKKGIGVIDPYFFDEIYPANYLQFKDIRLKRNIERGLGGAFVGHRKNNLDRHRNNPFLAPEGMSLPVNAVFDFSKGGDTVELAFYDLTVKDSTNIAGKEFRLSADRTASLATLYDYMPEGHVGWWGMLHPEKHAANTGLYQLEPYRSEKIPLVFVHGLLSSPLTWFISLNELFSDPVIRKHYQPLVYYYPTGFPVAYSSSILRTFLSDYQQHYNIRGKSVSMRKMVLIGHSLGGLLSSVQVRSSGDLFQSLYFTEPIDDISGFDDSQKKKMKAVMDYNANPSISRVIFVAAPHRGSNLAKRTIGDIGSALIKLPQSVITRKPLQIVPEMTDLGKKYAVKLPDAIEILKPRGPVLMTILKQPVRKGVSIHSIIGRSNPSDLLVDSNDTVVPYWSSHLRKAVSEKVVHAKHTTITKNHAAIEEMRRILYVHVGLTPRSAR